MLYRVKDKLNKMSSDERERYEIVVADASILHSYPESSFDTLVDTFGLCSIDDPAAVLKELQRVCKAGGKILLLEHGRSKTFQDSAVTLINEREKVWNRDISHIVASSGLKLEILHNFHFGTTYYIVCRPSKSTVKSYDCANVFD